MAYDAARQEIVLFGGKSGSVLGDTWTWDGEHWQLAASTGPSPREFHSMSYDPIRERVVLAGGVQADGARSPETWTWDGEQWTLAETRGFGTRFGFSTCFDATLGGVLLVGGHNESGQVSDQATVWDGTRWNDVSPFADQRYAQSMAYYEDRSESILFGGSGNIYVYDVQTWALRDGVWNVRADTGPVYRDWAVMSYYGEADGVVMFGGRDQFSNKLRDTWIWDGVWTEVPDSPVTARYHTAMAYDTARRELVLFGGFDEDGRTGDTWVFFCPPCLPDLTGDGVVDTLDFLLFLGAWATGDPLADWDQNGTINTLDFLAYLNDWVAGC